MENTIEQNSKMTAEESLSLITETLNNSRKEITRKSGRFFIFWGVLLTFFSLLIYALCKFTDNEAWNWLWFALPAIGIPSERFLRDKNASENVRNDVSRFVSGIWSTFGFFACAIGAFTLIYSMLSSSAIRLLAAVYGLIAELVLLFGLAECITGVALKNWAIKIAGFVTGVGGLAIYYIAGSGWEPMLIFTFAGLVLIATGLIIRIQYK